MMHSTLQRIFNRDFSSFFLIAGPCAVESYDVCAKTCEELLNICSKPNIPLVFKSSYRKANRTSPDSFRGVGDEKALNILAKIKSNFGVAISTDIHEELEVEMLGDIIDLIQIPAFLSRQTGLIEAAARSGKAVNIKKAQFMSANSAIKAAEKATAKGNQLVMLTERGNSFGYQDLIVDMRNIDQIAAQHITVMDCSHATQRPNSSIGVTGGNSHEIELFARCGIVAGANGLFIETHPDVQSALSDKESMLELDQMRPMVARLIQLSQSFKQIYG